MYDFYQHKIDNPIEIEVTLSADNSELQDMCYEENKIKIKQEIYFDNTRKYYYHHLSDNNYIEISDGPNLIESFFPMPVYIQGIEHGEIITKSISKFLHLVFQKGGISVKLNANSNIHEVIRQTPFMQELESRLNSNVIDLFQKIRFAPYMGSDKNVTIRSEEKEKGHIKIYMDSDEVPPLGLENYGDAVKRQLIISWALNKDFFSCVEKIKNLQEIKNFTPKNILILFEEPEVFAHPSAIRSMRDKLFKLANEDNIQLLCTTHSPILIDLTNESPILVRVLKENNTTSVYQFGPLDLTSDEKEHMQFILRFNPYVCEAFFSKRVLLVEGPTEEIAIKNTLSKLIEHNSIYKIVDNVEETLVINCGSKVNIPFFQKRLAQLKIPYVVFHDLDDLKDINGNYNSAWTLNHTILQEINIATNLGLQNIKRYIFEKNFEDAHKYEARSRDGKPFSAFKFIESINFSNPIEAQKEPIIKYLLDLFSTKFSLSIEKFDIEYLKLKEQDYE